MIIPLLYNDIADLSDFLDPKMNENPDLNQNYIDYSAPGCAFRAEAESQQQYFDERLTEMVRFNEYGEPPHTEPVGELCDECNGNIYYDRMDEVFWCACPR